MWRHRMGAPEEFTPLKYKATPPATDSMAGLPQVGECPIELNTLRYQSRPRGITVEISRRGRGTSEQFYGLGLQLGRLNMTGRKCTLRVNSDPIGTAGDSHAPVPFFISTAGYGVYVDTARYAAFYLGSATKTTSAKPASTQASTATDTEQLYAQRDGEDRLLVIDVPIAQGVDVYFFAGPTLLNVVQRYNLYSGGGCLPSMWGLGVWYRCFNQVNQSDSLSLAQKFRDSGLPCNVLGYEPGWQTKSYSCSLIWNKELFPDPDQLLTNLKKMGYEVNLWEHAFLHESSPLHKPMAKHAGDFLVWSGLVPDLSIAEPRQLFSDYHRTQFVVRGITGFKLDECDNSDFIPHSSWSFPEASQFPSGADGEQMHSMFGYFYQQAIHSALENQGVRTYSSVRSSGAFAAPLPFVLYSDLYDHRDFIRGIASSSFSGLLWTPEVRHATSREDLIRRIQSVVLSPQAVINAWYIKHPPWLQFDRKKNNEGELLEDAKELEAMVRDLFRLRMTLLPYLYSAFAQYHFTGKPPFRALALDYPNDPATHDIDDQYMMGDEILVAPMFAGESRRKVYLPAGDWFSFTDGVSFAGTRLHDVAAGLTQIPIFVRGGAILPLAATIDSVKADSVFEITPRAYGPVEKLRTATLFEDDGISFAFASGECGHVTIHSDQSVTRSGQARKQRYDIVGWEHFQ